MKSSNCQATTSTSKNGKTRKSSSRVTISHRVPKLPSFADEEHLGPLVLPQVLPAFKPRILMLWSWKPWSGASSRIGVSSKTKRWTQPTRVPKISLKGVVCGLALKAKTDAPFHVKGMVYCTRPTPLLSCSVTFHEIHYFTTTSRYYEWLNRGKSKLPHFTKRKDGKLLLMAGLYDSVVLEGRTLWTFTIVTTDANKEFSWLHDRQPVFLSDGDALDRWLDTSSQMWTPEFSKMVRPYSDTNVPLEWCVSLHSSHKNLKDSIHISRSYAVPTEVGKVGTESPSFIEPITSRKDGIQAMFSKQRQNSPTKSQPTVASPTKRRRESSISPLPEKVDHRSSASSQATTAGGSFQSKRLRSGDKDIDKSNKPDNVRLSPIVLRTYRPRSEFK